MKCAIYVRTSTVHLQSTDRQVSELTEFAKQNNFEIVKIYKEQLSGFKTEEQRPEFADMKQAAINGCFQIILFSEFTRLSRKISELNKQIENFQVINVSLFFQKQNLWIKQENDFATRITMQMLAVMATYEAELFAERSISGKIEKVKTQNISLGGQTVPYGYATNELKQIIVDTENKNVVQRIFEMYNTGISTRDISSYLEQNGIYGIKKNGWDYTQIGKMLKNRMYIGERTIVLHEPLLDKPDDKVELKKKMDERKIIETIEKQDESLRIISTELFQSVQEKLKYNNLNKNTTRKYDNLLKMLLKCGNCGNNYMSTRSNQERIYKCFKTNSDSLKIGETRCVDSVGITQEKLDGIIIACLIDSFIRNTNITDVNTNIVRWNELKEITETKIKIKEILKEDTILSIQKYVSTSSLSKYITPDMVSAFVSEKENEILNIDNDLIKLYSDLKLSNVRLIALQNTISEFDDEKFWEKYDINSIEYQYYYNSDNFNEVKRMIDELIEKIVITGIGVKKVMIVIHYFDGYIETIFTESRKHKESEISDIDTNGRTYFKLPLLRGEVIKSNDKLLYKHIEHTYDELISIAVNPIYGAESISYTKYIHK